MLASLVFFAVLSPWVIRNYETFGRFVFLRDDFGLQFRLGNGPYADGMLMAYLQPNLNKLELEKFQRMGELAYADDCKRQAFDWVRANPGRFAIVSLKRFFYYWNGVPRPTSSTSPVDFRTSAFPRDVGARHLGTAARPAAEAARSVAFRGTGADLSDDLLLRLPARALSSSDRTGADDPDCVRDCRSNQNAEGRSENAEVEAGCYFCILTSNF